MMTVCAYNFPKSPIDAIGYFNSITNRIDFDDSMIEEMIQSVDRTAHIKGPVFDSPWLGYIGPTQLSGGVKSLIMIKYLEEVEVFRSVLFGANCVEWLRKLSFDKDFILCFQHPLEFISGGAPTNVLAHKEICAKSIEGSVLRTCEDVWNYYLDKRVEHARGREFCGDEK